MVGHRIVIRSRYARHGNGIVFLHRFMVRMRYRCPVHGGLVVRSDENPSMPRASLIAHDHATR